MMLSAHNNVSEDSEKWSHLRFARQQVSVNLNDLSSSSSEDEQLPPTAVDLPEECDSSLNEGNSVTSTGGPILKKSKSLEKKVSFPSDESQLVSTFDEPINIESASDCQAEEATCQQLIDIYLYSCKKNVTEPIENIIEQLKTLDLSDPHSANLTLRGLTLGPHDCESLEDVLKHLPLKLLDLGASHCSDDGLIALFDMIEFYEAASHVSLAAHKNMTTRGWQACCRMIKRTERLEWLDAAQIGLSEHSSTLLARALRADSFLKVLQLNSCNLSGRPLSIIASSLRINRNLQELYLAENKLTQFDALQLGILLSGNSSLHIIDLRNNEIRDKGMIYLCDALMENSALTSLTVWNNGITQDSSSSLNQVLAKNQTLRTLNLGHNKLGDEGLIELIPGGLEYNRSLHNLGLQANGLTCCGIIALAESLPLGTQMHRVDLRKNSIELAGLMALAVALKLCPTVTCLDLDINSLENADEYERLNQEISDLCTAHQSRVDAMVPNPENGPIRAQTLMQDIYSRKESLTCSLPQLPVNDTVDGSQQQQQRGSRKLRSPLPSPLASPASPTGRFKVSQVELPSSLPSSYSRFTVTPVTSSRSFSGSSSDLLEVSLHPAGSSIDSKIPSPPNAELIRRTPSKIVVGFDVTPESHQDQQ